MYSKLGIPIFFYLKLTTFFILLISINKLFSSFLMTLISFHIVGFELNLAFKI